MKTDIFSDHCPVPIAGHGPGWIVVEKPSGISVHNDPGTDLCSRLSQFLLSHPKTAECVAYDNQYGLHPVHRLDKETSGVILLSCRRRVFDHCTRQFTQGLVTKCYLALVHGSVPAKSHWLSWRWPLTPKASGRRDPQGRGRRKPCKTHYRCLGHSHHYSLLKCRLDSGRTHQIRRHAVLAGHPLVGDRRYGSLRACRHLEKHHHFNRLGLHAAKLSIQMPNLEGRQHYTAKGLPNELERLWHNDT
jgi:RluA family pseudouridine synthase